MYIDKPFVEWGEEERVKYVERQYRYMMEAYDKYNAFITLLDFEDISNKLEGLRGMLKGLLIPIKDNISTMNIPTTCGSRILSNYIPPFNAHVVDVLLENGAIVVGKTNMDEFAMGNTGETSYFGPTLNPWDTNRVPGGSSSGSAVAVAYYGMVSLGSDTGGSVRNPASHTGVLGLKPTYGMVSRYGLVSYADSLEQIGVFSRYARDLAFVYYLITEYDTRDMTMIYSSERVEMRKKLLDFSVRGKGYLRDLNRFTFCYSSKLVEMADDNIKNLLYDTIDFIVGHGAVIVDVDLEILRAALPAYYIIAMVEASSNLARYDGSNFGDRASSSSYWDMVVRTRVDGFGEEVKRRIVMGAFASSKGYEGRYYIRALRFRNVIKSRIGELLNKFDGIILPTVPSIAPKLGEVIGPEGYVQDIYTVIPNLTGHPAINIPIGYIDNLPVGMQIVGRYLGEPTLISIAGFFEGKLYIPNRVPGGD
jgi:aspartyl-tRNA(Asn)/glutamyl-tRNA(Gln) amidotransferase subunit A